MLKKYPMKLRPVTKEILWGGNRLKERYHKTASFEKLGESWELTIRPDGMSIIDSGDYTGMSLEEIEEIEEVFPVGDGTYLIVEA